MEDNNNFQAALNAGAAISGVHIAGANGTPFLIVPEGCRLEALEKHLVSPVRKRGVVTVSTTQSFVDYTKKHGSLDDCTFYADVKADESRCKLVAIINDHGADKAQWRDHTCTFVPAQSIEWQRWLAKNGKSNAMSQVDFATWIEDNLGDIAAVDGMPTGAQMLTMALGFEANADKRLKSHVDLQNGGVRFEYVEDETKETKTSMEVFKRFTLGLPVFDGSSDAYPIEARLKYRDNQGKVTFWYELIRPDRAFKTAVNAALDKIKADTGFPIIFGTP